MNKYKYVLLGNSAAAISAVESIRSIDEKGSLAIVSAEDTLPYSPALTTYFISNTISEENVYYRKADFYKKNNIDTFLGDSAVKLDKRKRSVVLKSGKVLNYDKLLIATGGTPQLPELKGAHLDGVFTLRTLDDAKKIKERAKKSKSAVILGGGLVGLRAAYALHQIGLRVSIVVSSRNILSQNLDDESAKIMGDWLKDKNFNILTQTDVVSIEGKKEVEKVKLTNGKIIDAEIVIIGKGVRANCSFAKENGIKVDRGIIINDDTKTSDTNIYAAGDVAQGYDKLLGKNVINAIWPAATEQGRVAGINMAGGSEKYEGSISMNSVDFYGLSVLSIGLSKLINEEDYEIIVQSEPLANKYRKFVLKNDVIVGAILLGDIDRGGIITGLINEAVNIFEFKDSLTNDKFGFIVLPKKLRDAKLRTG